MNISFVFPHQLFENTPLPVHEGPVHIIEEYLFFNQYSFHKQKIVLHRASMKFYQDFLEKKGVKVVYTENHTKENNTGLLLKKIKEENPGFKELHYIDVHDDWMEKRIKKACDQLGIKKITYKSPGFLEKADEQKNAMENKKRFLHNDFYIRQRKAHKILIDKKGDPMGGKWSFDTENRKKYPSGKKPPVVTFPSPDEFVKEAITYTNKFFKNNPGVIQENGFYPTNFEATNQWFSDFLAERFEEFGVYEDAIVENENYLNHSVLTPMLNTGLITPEAIVKKTLDYGLSNNVPLNSIEGFIRQIIGWREYMRIIYILIGGKQRTRNFWNFKTKMPETFYSGKTGIIPFDQTIEKVINTGYCHHIERLMVLGNFMLLCEIKPDDVYQWFMELFIDAYDWVMVPNVYGMSQFADGGLLSTKPYISGSNYLIKMSNYPKGKWQDTWDGLYWQFIDKHRHVFLKNQRMLMMVKMYDKMPDDKKIKHQTNAHAFLEKFSI
ncbi:MAG: cryptochrome/photolyase family protein [Bacteroidales bacterium]